MRTVHVVILAMLAASPAIAQSEQAKILVLQKDEGETRVRRPRDAPVPASEFILKVTPENSGSKHLVLGTETIPPGGRIPRHQHLGQDEILFLQTGRARVTLNDETYDVGPGGLVFFPYRTWVSLENTGPEPIALIFVFSAPGFEAFMRCTSAAPGEPLKPLTADEMQGCAHQGHVELGYLKPAAARSGGERQP